VSVNSGVTTRFTAIAAPSGGVRRAFGAYGSLSFDDASPTLLSIGAECFPGGGGCYVEAFPGDSGSKVEAVTGWTGGVFVNTGLATTGSDGFVRLNSGVIKGNADPGDSGSPVLDQSKLRLIGIQWGATSSDSAFYYSTWSGVSSDLSADEFSLHVTGPQLLGYENRWMFPAECPTNPDAWDVYIITGYPKAGGQYKTTTAPYAGYTTYQCSVFEPPVNGTFASSSQWIGCTTYFGGSCPCAFHTVGSVSCPVLQP
jgi:hypothetical protein